MKIKELDNVSKILLILLIGTIFYLVLFLILKPLFYKTSKYDGNDEVFYWQ